MQQKRTGITVLQDGKLFTSTSVSLNQKTLLDCYIDASVRDAGQAHARKNELKVAGGAVGMLGSIMLGISTLISLGNAGIGGAQLVAARRREKKEKDGARPTPA